MMDQLICEELEVNTDRRLWNRLARSAKLVSPTVLEVPDLFRQRLRFILTAFSLFMFGVVGYDQYSTGTNLLSDFKDDIEFVYFLEDALKINYERSKSVRETLGEPVPTIEEYVQDFEKWKPFWVRFRSSLIPTFLMMLFVFGGLLISIFSPIALPVRFDREMRLAYTKRGRHIYVARMGKGRYLLKDEIKLSTEDTTPILTYHGGGDHVLVVELYRLDKPEKKKKFRLGAYPCPLGPAQGYYLGGLVKNFCKAPPTERPDLERLHFDETWLGQLYRDKVLPLDWLRWWLRHASLIPRRFNNKKLDKTLLEFATRPE
ncbi:hypothetical protein [Thioclava sp. GXIMD4216]|uniref:hypothetical protein n=1 Tax=Thioclava sp. GXIMD4216 TaxID=3131929 RepID=UPI0030D3ABB1